MQLFIFYFIQDIIPSLNKNALHYYFFIWYLFFFDLQNHKTIITALKSALFAVTVGLVLLIYEQGQAVWAAGCCIISLNEGTG